MRIAPIRRSQWLVVAALAAVGTVAACATTVGGSGQVRTSGATAGTAAGTDFPSAGTTAPSSEPAPSTTASPAPSGTLPVAHDITSVRYKIPAGFVRNNNFQEAVPLEASYQAKFFTPSSATASGLDVITVLLYRLPGTHLVDTRAQQVARVLAYNRKLRVILKSSLENTIVGGRPAFDEAVVQPGGYHYTTWFLFGGAHLVQISCQVATHVAAVAAGCKTLLASVIVG